MEHRNKDILKKIIAVILAFIMEDSKENEKVRFETWP